MKKIIFYGLLAGLAMLIANFILSAILNYLFTALSSEYNNTNLFRPWSDPLMFLFFAHPFVLGVIWAWVWSKTKALFTSEKDYENGLNFGFVFWLVSLPGMLISYSCFQISLTMALSWTLGILVQALIAGFVFSKAIK